MRTFTILWLGQLVSTIGTYMTGFALEIWVWQVTGSATSLALIQFFNQLSRIVINLFSGVIVDRFNRKQIMFLGDTVAALISILLLSLYLTNNLQIWHLYLTGSIVSIFGELQQLAYSSSLSSLVSPSDYTRASSMSAALHYGSLIIAPAVAAILYPAIGIGGMLAIDILSFACGIITLSMCAIPQPEVIDRAKSSDIWEELSLGFRFIFTDRVLLNFLVWTLLPFWFVHDLAEAVNTPMILAKSNGNVTILGQIGMAAGFGGVTGAICVNLWKGFKQPIVGVAAGMIGAGISKTIFGLGRIAPVWLGAQFCSSLNFPLISSAETTIWLTHVPPQLQGRVFAASGLLTQLVSAVAALIAGPLADVLLEPMFRAGNSPIAHLFSPIVGIGAGSGMALLYVSCSVAMVAIGLKRLLS